MGSAMALLVTRVASDKPTLLETVFCATPPASPENNGARPFARIPPLMDFMSVRFQSASLIFWQRVKSPTVFRLAVRLAIRNGASLEARNDIPAATGWGC